MAELTDTAREEFFSEASDIIEAFSRNLLLLEGAGREGEPDPALVNEAFRAVHTLKGLAGLFGAVRLGTLSHRLEDLLDALRLGRRELTSEVLDVLFAAVDVFTVVLEAERTGEKETLPALEALYTELERIGTAEPADAGGVLDYELD